MAYRLPTDRVQVTVEDLTVEVSSVVAWPIAHTTAKLYAAYEEAAAGDAELTALRALYEYFVLEAQPTFDAEDHRGRISPTPVGLLRLPLNLVFGLINEWLSTLRPKSTAADEVLPHGPVRDEVNAALRAASRKGRRGG